MFAPVFDHIYKVKNVLFPCLFELLKVRHTRSICSLLILQTGIPLSTTTQNLALRVGNEEVTVDTINRIPVNDTTQIADFAFVQLIPEDSSVFTRVNGETAVGLDISRQSVHRQAR